MAIGPDDIIRMPLPDEDSGEQHDCAVCHGAGDFVCSDGCHTQACDECDGSGRLWADDSPVPPGEVAY